MSRRKVVVTGLGLITPIGLDGESTWRSLLEGRSGVARIQAFDPTEFRTQIAAEVRDFDPASVMDLKEVRKADRFAQMAIGAAAQAMAKIDLFGHSPKKRQRSKRKKKDRRKKRSR